MQLSIFFLSVINISSLWSHTDNVSIIKMVEIDNFKEGEFAFLVHKAAKKVCMLIVFLGNQHDYHFLYLHYEVFVKLNQQFQYHE